MKLSLVMTRVTQKDNTQEITTVVSANFFTSEASFFFFHGLFFTDNSTFQPIILLNDIVLCMQYPHAALLTVAKSFEM